MRNFTPIFSCGSVKTFALASIAALAVFTMVTPPAHSRTITAEEALERVMGTAQSEAKVLNFQVNPTLVYTKLLDSTETPGLYVFSNADGRGFIVASADDEARALLGYSDSGKFDPNNIPAPMEYWLNCYTQEIACLEHESQLKERVVANAPEKSLAPMVKTRWAQTTPYNNQCPQFSGYNTVTGCSATALAQIMKYFNYPERGKGHTQYSWNGQLLSSNFSAHTYKWENMLDSYTGDYNTAQEEAISQLMSDCAIASHTDFGIDNSGATNPDVRDALINNFGYDPQVRYMLRKYY